MWARDRYEMGKNASSGQWPFCSLHPSCNLGVEYEKMALPSHLRTSITPEELELVASEQLVEIIPLVAMERTAFISVR